jgi:hypothetical protein
MRSIQPQLIIFGLGAPWQVNAKGLERPTLQVKQIPCLGSVILWPDNQKEQGI